MQTCKSSLASLLFSELEPETVTSQSRLVGNRPIILPAPVTLSDDVASASVPEKLPKARLSEVLEPSEFVTKKRRVESFDESVDWFQRERSSVCWLTDSLHERAIFEIDVGDPLECENLFVEIHRYGDPRDC